MHTHLSEIASHVPAIEEHLKFILPTICRMVAKPAIDFAFHKVAHSGLHLFGHRVNRIGHLFHKHPVVLDGAMLILLVAFGAVTEGHEAGHASAE